jgi:hypothetical protein
MTLKKAEYQGTNCCRLCLTVLQILKGVCSVNFNLVTTQAQLKYIVALNFGAAGVNVRGEGNSNCSV